MTPTQEELQGTLRRTGRILWIMALVYGIVAIPVAIGLILAGRFPLLVVPVAAYIIFSSLARKGNVVGFRGVAATGGLHAIMIVHFSLNVLTVTGLIELVWIVIMAILAHRGRKKVDAEYLSLASKRPSRSAVVHKSD